MAIQLMQGPAAADLSRPRHELRFAVPSELAPEVEERLWSLLAPAGWAAADPAVAVSTLWLDTAAMDAFHGAKGFVGRRYRVRSTGRPRVVQLELKRKRRGRTVVRSAEVLEAELSRLAEPASCEGWAGDWFAEKVAARDLRPCCLVRFERLRFCGAGFAAALDTGMTCWASDRYALCADGPGTPIFGPAAQLELTFDEAVPTCLRRLVADLRLEPARCSKIRAAVETLRIAGRGGGKQPCLSS